MGVRRVTLPTNSLIAFPVASRQWQVRQAAETLSQTHGEAAAVYWKELIRSIADPLIAIGIPDEQVRRQVFEFQDSVQAELQTLVSSASGSN